MKLGATRIFSSSFLWTKFVFNVKFVNLESYLTWVRKFINLNLEKLIGRIDTSIYTETKLWIVSHAISNFYNDSFALKRFRSSNPQDIGNIEFSLNTFSQRLENVASRWYRCVFLCIFKFSQTPLTKWNFNWKNCSLLRKITIDAPFLHIFVHFCITRACIARVFAKILRKRTKLDSLIATFKLSFQTRYVSKIPISNVVFFKLHNNYHDQTVTII